MVSVIFNRTRTALYQIPINAARRRLFSLPIGAVGRKLQNLTDILKHTLTEQASFSSIIFKIMGINKNDLRNIILILGFTIIVFLLLFMFGRLCRMLGQNYTKKRHYSSCLNQQSMINHDIIGRHGRFEVNFQSETKSSVHSFTFFLFLYILFSLNNTSFSIIAF